MTRLCDLSIGDLEERADAAALTVTGYRPDDEVDPEDVADWLEAEAYLASLVDPSPWVDADVVIAAGVKDARRTEAAA